MRWVLAVCPFDSSHTNGSAFVVQFASGAIAAGCLHNSCNGLGWRELRERIDAKREEVITEAASAPAPTGATADPSPGVSSRSMRDADSGRGRAGTDFQVGDLVSPADRENLGEVVAIESGFVVVHFVNAETGESADRCFPPAALLLKRRKPQQQPIRILTTRELLELPASTWLVRGVIRRGELVMMFGQPGCGKTLTAIDMALSIAHGRDWCGAVVVRGVVLYIAAEGVTGLGIRVRAWAGGTITNPDAEPWMNFNVIGEAVQFLDEQYETFLKVLASLAVQPILIIFDTLARCSVGADENSSKDMGRVIQAADRLRKQTGATVVVIHHATKAKDKEKGAAAVRGSSAWHGAVDTLLEVTGDAANKVSIACEKQKEAERFSPIVFELEVVKVNLGGVSEPVSGCRLKLSSGGVSPSRPRDRETPASLAILKTLEESFRSKSVTATTLRETARVPKSTFYKTLQRLVERGEVEELKVRGHFEYRRTSRQGLSTVSTVSQSLSAPRANPGPEVAGPLSPFGGRGPETGPETETGEPPGHPRSPASSRVGDHAGFPIRPHPPCGGTRFYLLADAPNWICERCYAPDTTTRVAERFELPAEGGAAAGAEGGS
jgi:hypothetical protein